MRTARIAGFAALMLLLATSLAAADPVTWMATSKTAMSITGDIVLDDYSLTFANGQSLDLEPYEADSEGDWAGSGQEVQGFIYKIDPPTDPKLLHGNSLCDQLVTYVVVWSPGEGELTLNVYSSKETPSGTDGLCASYSYETP
jgi:hypothetical protein